MQNNTTNTPVHRRDGISRRALLAVAGAGIAGSVAAAGMARAAYAPSDQNLSFTCRSSGKDVVVTASWTWADDNSGEPPEDVAIIYWEDAGLEYEEYQTTDGIQSESSHGGDGVRGREFRHDDTLASEGTEYAASVRLRPSTEDPTVYLDYTHTYGDTEIREVNVGRDGDGQPTSEVRTSDDEKKWEKTRQLTTSECGH